MKTVMMAIKIRLLMDALKAVQLMMDMLVQEDQLPNPILALSVHLLEELYPVIREVEILFEEMALDMSQNNEMMIIQILMMDVVKSVQLKKAMLEVEDLYLEAIHALSVLSLNSLHLMTKVFVSRNEEMDSNIQ